MRASPDGVISCKYCGKGLLEIECPHSKQATTAEEIAREGKYHLQIGNNGKILLKQNSPWYTQVKTQLGVAKYVWCDFVIFTKRRPYITIERMCFDKDRFETELTRGLAFYDKFVLPKLIKKSTNSLHHLPSFPRGPLQKFWDCPRRSPINPPSASAIYIRSNPMPRTMPAPYTYGLILKKSL